MGKHHGYKNTRIYRIWCSMKARCLNEKNPAYQMYGGSGVSVCERWLVFTNFLEDMGEPQAGLSIEREDNDGNYEPGNCRWATATEQALNRRSNHMMTVDGVTKPMSLWAIDAGLAYSVLHQRVYAYGWSPEVAIKTPLTRQRKRRPDGAFCVSNDVELHETERCGFLSERVEPVANSNGRRA